MQDQVKKEITIGELAQMVAGGFENIDKKFEGIDKEFKSVHQEIEKLAISTASGFAEVHKEINGQNNEIKGIKGGLSDLKEYMNYRFTGLENRVDDLAMNRVKNEDFGILKERVLVLEKR